MNNRELTKDLTSISPKVDVTADLPAVKFTKEDIRKHFCPLATEQEVLMGLAIVKSLNLNPFLRQVHFIKYSQKDKMAIVVGYEVYLQRAERSGRLNGWKSGINTAENYAWVKIWRKDWTEPFEWTVNLDEFNKKQSTWKQIPSFMGRKVAIAQGFRLCFPEELGGMPYTEEEHQVYDIDSEPTMKPEVQMPKALPDVDAPKASPEPSVSDSGTEEIQGDQNTRLEAFEALAIAAFNKNKPAYLEWLGVEYGVEKASELTDEQTGKATQELKDKLKNVKT